jgi:hypothetical protein
MLNGNGHPVVAELVAFYQGLIAISTPDPMVTFKYPVPGYPIAAEGYLDPVGRCIGKIIFIQEIIIASSLAAIHGRLTCPKEKTISPVRHIIAVKDIVIALLVNQDARAVLAPVIDSMAITPHIKDETVIDYTVTAASI